MSFDQEASYGAAESDREITPEAVYERVAEIYAETARAKQRADELASYQLADVSSHIVRASGSELDRGIAVKLSVILPQILERIERKNRGEEHLAVRPVETLPTGNLFIDTVPIFLSALTIAAKANGQTFIGKINGVELEIGPESVLEELVEQYHIKLESLIRLPVDRVL